MFLRELQYILKIAEEGSITHAAQKLYLSQPSLSQFLMEYETALGFPLFVRTARGVTPTAAGRQFIAVAKELVNTFSATQARLAAETVSEIQPIRFGISEQRGLSVTPSLLTTFSENNPGVPFEIIDAKASTLWEMVHRRDLGMAMVATLSENTCPYDDVSIKPLLKEEIMVAVPRRHPLMQKVKIDREGGMRWLEIRSLHGQDYVLSSVGRTLRAFSEQFFKKNGIVPQNVQTSTNIQTILKLCSKINRLTFIPVGLVASCKTNDMEYISIGKRRKYWDIVLIRPSGSTVMPAESAFERILLECLKETMTEPHLAND